MSTTSSLVYDSALLLENILPSVFYCLLFEFKTPVLFATFSELYRQQFVLFWWEPFSLWHCIALYSHALHLTHLCNMPETVVSIVAHDNAQRRFVGYVLWNSSYHHPTILCKYSMSVLTCVYRYWEQCLHYSCACDTIYWYQTLSLCQIVLCTDVSFVVAVEFQLLKNWTRCATIMSKRC